MCALVLKRGRGRPRLNESREFNESDLQLISEFKQRPALYNKNHPLYRDRENTDRLWQEMSIILNTPVSQIKERTTQLRNRYNIERRRSDMVEQLDDSTSKSQWPLFDHLSFLSDHIKPRRPIQQSRPASPNPPKRLKIQQNESSSEDDERDITGPIIQPHSLASNSLNYYIDNGADTERSFNGPINYTNGDQQHNIPAQNGNKREIYEAFGHFVSTSLIGMKEKDALHLLQKFTKELVHTMRESPHNYEIGDNDQ